MNSRENQVRIHIFLKTIKQKMKRKKSVWVISCLKNCLETSEFNNVFADLKKQPSEVFCKERYS